MPMSGARTWVTTSLVYLYDRLREAAADRLRKGPRDFRDTWSTQVVRSNDQNLWMALGLVT